MAFLDMFDKLDDIVYAPIDAICSWVKEPMKSFEARREIKKMDKEAEIELNKAKQESELKAYDARQIVELEIDQRRWNAEIDTIIAQQMDERRDKLVESLKQYQLELATASKNIVEEIGKMSLDLREKANNMMLEKIKEYKKIQDEAKQQSISEIKEAKELFFDDDPETYKTLVSKIMDERSSTVDLAKQFIQELSEDFKRLNQNTDMLMKESMKNVDKYLSPMAKALQLEESVNLQKKIEDKS